RDLISSQKDRSPIGQARSEGGARRALRHCPVDGAHTCPKSIVDHWTQLLLFVARELAIKNRFRDFRGGFHGGIFTLGLRLPFLLTLRSLRVLQLFPRFAPGGLELVHHPGCSQSASRASHRAFPDRSVFVPHSAAFP